MGWKGLPFKLSKLMVLPSLGRCRVTDWGWRVSCPPLPSFPALQDALWCCWGWYGPDWSFEVADGDSPGRSCEMTQRYSMVWWVPGLAAWEVIGDLSSCWEGSHGPGAIVTHAEQGAGAPSCSLWVLWVHGSCSAQPGSCAGLGMGVCSVAVLEILPCCSPAREYFLLSADYQLAAERWTCHSWLCQSSSLSELLWGFLSFCLHLLSEHGGNGYKVKMKYVYSLFVSCHQFSCFWEEWEHWARKHVAVFVLCRWSNSSSVPLNNTPPQTHTIIALNLTGIRAGLEMLPYGCRALVCLWELPPAPLPAVEWALVGTAQTQAPRTVVPWGSSGYQPGMNPHSLPVSIRFVGSWFS